MALTIAISGGNSGIGLEAGRQLAREGHQVVLLGRDPAKGAAAVASIKGSGGRADFLASDLSTHAGVREAATKLEQAYPRIDGLILGAGVLTTDDLRTSDGLHAMVATNYLSRYHLTQLLLPKLKAAGSSTVVLLVAQVRLTTRIDFARFPRYQPWPKMAALPQLQIANHHYVKHLATAEPTVRAGVCNVGLVKTEVMRIMPAPLRLAFNLTAPLFTIPVERSASNPVWLTTHGEWKTGRYWPKPGAPERSVDLAAELPADDTAQVIEASRGLTGA